MDPFDSLSDDDDVLPSGGLDSDAMDVDDAGTTGYGGHGRGRGIGGPADLGAFRVRPRVVESGGGGVRARGDVGSGSGGGGGGWGSGFASSLSREREQGGPQATAPGFRMEHRDSRRKNPDSPLYPSLDSLASSLSAPEPDVSANPDHQSPATAPTPPAAPAPAPVQGRSPFLDRSPAAAGGGGGAGEGSGGGPSRHIGIGRRHREEQIEIGRIGRGRGGGSGRDIIFDEDGFGRPAREVTATSRRRGGIQRTEWGDSWSSVRDPEPGYRRERERERERERGGRSRLGGFGGESRRRQMESNRQFREDGDSSWLSQRRRQGTDERHVRFDLDHSGSRGTRTRSDSDRRFGSGFAGGSEGFGYEEDASSDSAGAEFGSYESSRSSDRRPPRGHDDFGALSESELDAAMDFQPTGTRFARRGGMLADLESPDDRWERLERQRRRHGLMFCVFIVLLVGVMILMAVKMFG